MEKITHFAHFSHLWPHNTPKSPKNHQNEPKTTYFTPKNHLKVIWNKSVRKKFRPFFGHFSTFVPIIARSSGQKQPNATKPGLKPSHDFSERANTK